jgi:HoxN/HupN/NixA family high-affinity nickel-transporter
MTFQNLTRRLKLKDCPPAISDGCQIVIWTLNKGYLGKEEPCRQAWALTAGRLRIQVFVNWTVLRSVYRVFVRVRNRAPYVEEDLNLLLADHGLLARLFRPMFAMIQHSLHMYPLGLLFGLGFDTATEIGLLSISATESSKGLAKLSTLVFPALFAAGMSLVDTTDNILMLGAYGWAFMKPVRKLYYNMTITLVSVVVALVVGGIESLGFVRRSLSLQRDVMGHCAEAQRQLRNARVLHYRVLCFELDSICCLL